MNHIHAAAAIASQQINDGGPAYPQSDLSAYGMGPGPGSCAGMSLRDYLAVHAPSEIPEWFEHDQPAPVEVAGPRLETLPEHLREIAKPWLDDQDYDLAESLDEPMDNAKQYSKDFGALSAFEAHWKQYNIAKAMWSIANKIGRYTQWRFAYADLMLAERTRANGVAQ